MHCPYKNSYLQMVVAINPRVINKVVDTAMQKKSFDMHCSLPAAQRLESMQPSLYAPHVDYTRARLGFGKRGLRLINRDLHAKDPTIQLQALHSVLDQVQISESALFLIEINVVYRVIDLMLDDNSVIREKVCLILTHLAKYYQGRQRIMSRLVIVDNLLKLISQDGKEIRYAAANALKTLACDRCACEYIMQHNRVIETVLRMIKHEYRGIILLHLQTFANLAEWDPVRPLKAHAFQVLYTLFFDEDPCIVALAMDGMAQLCKHEVGRRLADEHDITFVLRPFLELKDVGIIIAAAGLMCYSTLTTRSKWRAKECISSLSARLVQLCKCYNKPVLQLRCLQILINLCDCPDVRYHLKRCWEASIKTLPIRTHEEWDGTSEITSYGLETGTNYRTMCREGIETIKNDYGDNALVVNVHSYLRTIHEKRARLLAAINYKPYL